MAESSSVFTEAIIIGRSGGGGSGGKNCLVYGKTDGEAGKFDKLTVMPTTDGNPLRYNGEFRATRIYGVYYSDDADVAENYEISGKVEFGDLVCIDKGGKIKKNKIPENTKTLGIVSENPAVVLGSAIKGVPIALKGRVMMNCEGEIHAGDYLCAGETPGCVKACDIENTKRGSIVGIALKDYNGDPVNNKVLAFVVRM